MLRLLTTLSLALVPSAALAQPTVPDDPARPLSREAQAIATDVPNESTPRPDEHYPVSNETRHDLFFEHVRDLGGAFVGVGADQCYTIAAAQNATMLWVVDFDPLVPLVHRIYGVLVPLSETPDALIDRFSAENADATTAVLREALAGDPQADAIVRAFRVHRSRMHPYLRRARRHSRAGSWVADPALYARVRALHRGGRVVARNGDVTADGALRAVGRAAQRLSIPVRVIYFSNAEQFFPYGAGFRANLAGLPTDARTMVLRTFRGDGAVHAAGSSWHYLVQPYSDMQARLSENGYRHSRQFVLDVVGGRRNHMGADGLSVLDARVPRRFDLRAESRATPDRARVSTN